MSGSFPSSPLLLPLLSLSLLLLSVTTSGMPIIPSIPSCSSTVACGDYLDIHYPFWVVNDASSAAASSYCGYPGFNITCQNKVPILSLSNDNYTLINIDYDTTTISVVNTDVHLGADACPKLRHNFTLESNPLLGYTPADANLSFFFNCSEGPAAEHLLCLGDFEGKYSYVNITDPLPITYPSWAKTCAEIVDAPVLRENITDLPTGFGGVLRKGFELQWSSLDPKDCPLCENSGGHCGYYEEPFTSSRVFTCYYCPNGPQKAGPCNQKDNGQTKRIAVGVGVGAGGFIVASALCFLWFRRKKQRKYLASSALIRSSSSEPPSSKGPELGNANYQTHLFSYAELREATNCFDESKELGDGGYGTVYKGMLRDGRVVAVKRLYENNYKRVEQFMNEIAILSRLRHGNLVTLYGCTSHQSRELLLVYEFVPNGTVADHLHGSRAYEGALTWPIRLSIAIETADALSYLHAIDPPIIHRDVKTNNILLDSSFHVKVADFGLSRLFPTDVTHVSTAPQGTPGYLDPEYHQCYQLTDKSDVYSFGVVLAELISSKPAVDITRNRYEINLASMAINKIQNRELEKLVDSGLGYESNTEVRRMIAEVAELAFRCLQGDRDMRPPIKEVLEVLKEIQSGGFAAEKVVEADALMRDDVALMKKNIPPYSPDSVTDRWASRSTTPNTSN